MTAQTKPTANMAPKIVMVVMTVICWFNFSRSFLFLASIAMCCLRAWSCSSFALLKSCKSSGSIIASRSWTSFQYRSCCFRNWVSLSKSFWERGLKVPPLRSISKLVSASPKSEIVPMTCWIPEPVSLACLMSPFMEVRIADAAATLSMIKVIKFQLW